MIELFEVSSVRSAEAAHQRELDSGLLMQRAATGLAVAIADLVGGVRGRCYGARVVLLIGSGNNGGDALFAGAVLARRGMRVDALCIAEGYHAEGASALIAAGGSVRRWQPGDDPTLDAADAIVDGIVGIGANGRLREPAAQLVERANACDALRIAVDVPSGVDADSGRVDGVVFDADLTVTFGAAKPGLVLAPAKEHVGQITVIDIEIGDALGNPAAVALQGIDVAGVVPEPAFDDHKYRRGVAGIAAGSARYRGAALLATGAAVSSEVGMVAYLDRSDGLAAMVIAECPEVVVTATADAPRVSAWGCGCGFEAVDSDAAAIEAVLRTSLPVVLDAGALTVVAGNADLQRLIRDRASATVLTPHEGEFARLGGDLGAGRLGGARALAAAFDAVVVLKGPGSVIAAPDGSTFIDVAGGPELATAGSGDVLTGIMAALLAGAHARGGIASMADVARVAAAACWVHGTAARIAGGEGQPVHASGIRAAVGAAIAACRRLPGE